MPKKIRHFTVSFLEDTSTPVSCHLSIGRCFPLPFLSQAGCPFQGLSSGFCLLGPARLFLLTCPLLQLVGLVAETAILFSVTLPARREPALFLEPADAHHTPHIVPAVPHSSSPGEVPQAAAPHGQAAVLPGTSSVSRALREPEVFLRKLSPSIASP